MEIIFGIFIAIFGILLEHFVIAPIRNSKWGTSLADSFKERVDVSVSFIKKIFPNLIYALKVVSEKALEAIAYVSVVFVLFITFSWGVIYPYLEIVIAEQQRWDIPSSDPKEAILVLLILFFLISNMVLAFLETRILQVSLVIIVSCFTLIFLNVFSPFYIYGNKFSVAQENFIWLAVVLAAMWSVVLIIFARQDEKFEYFDNKLSFLINIPEISSLFEKESLKLTERIQVGWLRFINHPWADDYMIKTTGVPVKCEGYLLTIGYQDSLEETMLQNVKNALTEDIRSYYKIHKLKIRFEKIEVSQYKEIMHLLNLYKDAKQDVSK